MKYIISFELEMDEPIHTDKNSIEQTRQKISEDLFEGISSRVSNVTIKRNLTKSEKFDEFSQKNG